MLLLERIREKEKENLPRSSSKMPKIPSLFFFFFFFFVFVFVFFAFCLVLGIREDL